MAESPAKARGHAMIRDSIMALSGTSHKPIRTFYIGAGNPVQPKSGMDVVAKAHIDELSNSDQIDLCGVFVNLPSEDTVRSYRGLTKFSAEGRYSNIRKLRHLLSGRLMMSIGFASPPAQKAVRSGIAAIPDLIIIDHIQALTNVSLIRLILCKIPLVFIAHNVTSDTLLDAARLRKSVISKLFLRIEAIQAWLVESLLIWRANKTIFISHNDEDRFKWISSDRSLALCPVISGVDLDQAAREESSGERRVLFIGSPNFPPNREAIDWIVTELAPRLLKIDPTLKVTFIGGAVREYLGAHAANIEPLGFVEDAEMRRTIRDCVCFLSPVVHGSGLKIKLLEAFSAGAPVLATALSMQGFGFMNLQESLALDRPDKAAHDIMELAESLNKRETAKASVRENWGNHVQKRKGALVSALLDLFPASKA